MDVSMMDYQVRARETAIYPEAIQKMLEDASTPAIEQALRLSYSTLGLAGEAGEFANKVKKVIRDHHGNLPDEIRSALVEELGDVLWYVADLCTVLGTYMSDVAKRNITKLALRAQEDKIKGSGDTR